MVDFAACARCGGKSDFGIYPESGRFEVLSLCLPCAQVVRDELGDKVPTIARIVADYEKRQPTKGESNAT